MIPRRFNGPPDSGNGGYTCGLVAALLGDGPAEVSLRSPPPLDTELEVKRDGDSVVLLDGDTVVADGRATELDLELPEAVGAEEAARASRAGYEQWAPSHPFPGCVVCGPDREQGDGMRIFPGRLAGSELCAAGWTPSDSIADETGHVRPECVWAALDCPTSAPVANYGEGPPMVLARLAARLDAPVEAGRPHALVSWGIERDGRKRHSASALFSEEGRPLALARALWIELRL